MAKNKITSRESGGGGGRKLNIRYAADKRDQHRLLIGSPTPSLMTILPGIREPSISQTATPDPFLNVPQELWLDIFHYATIGTCIDNNVNYVPFAAVALQERDNPRIERRCVETKRTLLLVCKAWNALATETVYRTIRISHGTNQLLDSLNMDASSEKVGGGNGRLVRNVEIKSRVQDFDPFNPTIVAQIFAHCPNMVTLTRPFAFDGMNLAICKVRVDQGSQQNTQTVTHFPTLSALRRVDWWLPLSIPSRSPNPSSTGFFHDLLGDIIDHAPNLQYLTIGAPLRSYMSSHHYTSSPILCLRNLTTLRLECDLQFDEANLQAKTWQLPNLTHLLVGTSHGVAISVLEACGSHLKVLEIVRETCPRADRFGAAPFFDFLSTCPNLEEFNFPIDNFEDRDVYESMRPAKPPTLPTIRLCFGLWPPVSLAQGRFGFLTNPHYLPRLSKLVIYNHCQWREAFQRPDFLLVKQSLLARSCSLEFA